MRNLLYRQNLFNREKITLCLGSLVLVLGAISPWYQLPKQALEIFGTNLFWANAVKVTVALFAILGFTFTFWIGISRTPRLAFWSGLIATLLFPYFIVTWSPGVNFLAQAYYEQGEAVTHHVERNFPYIQAQWKHNVLLPQSVPLTSTFQFSIKDSRFFQMSSWDYLLIEGLGYSKSFFQFIGRGWILTVLGLAISLLALYVGFKEEGIGVFLKDMGKFLPWVGLLLGTIVFSLIFANIVNYQLDTMFAKGEYHRVVATSQTLVSWYPPLRGDQTFLQRWAAAGFYSNEPNTALINFAKGLERYRLGDFHPAEEYFQKSLVIQPSRFLIRGYLASAILNQGVNYFNDPSLRKPRGAADRFQEVLRIFPDHLEALYNLMLALVVNGELEKSADTARQIIESQKYFQQPNMALLGQAYLHLAWASYDKAEFAQAWKRYRQSIDSSTWGNPENEFVEVQQ